MSGPFDASTPGPRDHLVTRALEQALAELEPDSFVTEGLEVAEAPRRLARHLGIAVQRALASLADSDDGALAAQATQLNALLDQADPEEVGDLIAFPPRILTELRTPTPAGGYAKPARLPKTPLGQSDLLVNAVGQPNIGSELQAELATATRVDLLCAFVIMSGVSQLRDALRGVIDRGGEVRVITTTYMGATERAAVDALVELGATVKIALDARTTKLHAKAWLIERPAGMTTAFIGSSNLSHTALFDGLEWNVRLSRRTRRSSSTECARCSLRTGPPSSSTTTTLAFGRPMRTGSTRRSLATTSGARERRTFRSRRSTCAPTRTSSACSIAWTSSATDMIGTAT